MSAAKVAPIALLWGMFLALTYFNITDLSLKDNIAVLDASVWKGLKEGFKIVVMIFGAFTILNALKATGAIEDVKAAITQFSGEDRRAQLIIIGVFVPIFLEGAASFCRSERRGLSGQPHLPQQCCRSLRNCQLDRQRGRCPADHLPCLFYHPDRVHDHFHALHLHDFPRFRTVKKIY